MTNIYNFNKKINNKKVIKDTVMYDTVNVLLNENMQIFMNALTETLKKDYGFGDKRINKFMENFNKHLPSNYNIKVG